MIKNIKPHWILLAPGLVLLGIAFIVPLVQILAISFFHNTPNGAMEKAFSFENYIQFFTGSYYLKILLNTFKLGLISSFICLVLGYCLAYGAARANPKYRSLLLLLVVLPLLTSAVVRSFGWIILLGNNGIINKALLSIGIISEPLQLLHNFAGVVIAMVHILLPFMVLILYSTIEKLDRNLENAAANLGASPIKVFWFVTLPLTKPAILAGTLLVFSMSISFYVTPAMIGGPKNQVMATAIYDQTINLLNWPFASAIAWILLAAVLVILYFYNKSLASGYLSAAEQE